jgi:hypothetical protein
MNVRVGGFGWVDGWVNEWADGSCTGPFSPITRIDVWSGCPGVDVRTGRQLLEKRILLLLHARELALAHTYMHKTLAS